MTFKTWIGPLRIVIVVSHQEDLPSPYNNSQDWEWKYATEADREAYGYDKFVTSRPRGGDMQLGPPDPLL